MEGVPAVAINMFEGARRIAKLIAVFIVVGFGIVIVTESAQPVRLEYALSEQNHPPALTESCSYGLGTREVRTDNNRQVLVTLCFVRMPKRTSAPSEDLPAVVRELLLDMAKDEFRIPAADESHINSLWWSQTIKNAGLYFLGMLASLAGWGAFTWAVGWIVRGFMGVPRGSDSRGSTASET